MGWCYQSSPARKLTEEETCERVGVGVARGRGGAGCGVG